MAYSAAYDGYRTPQAVARRTISAHSNHPYSGMYEDYARYPYGEPVRDAYSDPYAQQSMYDQAGYSGYATPRMSAYYGNGASTRYDEQYYGTPDEYEYATPAASAYTAHSSALTPVPRARRNSSVSFSHTLSSSSPYRASLYDSSYATRRPMAAPAPLIKFRAKGALRGGLSLSDAVAGVKLSGGDYVKWHEINADARGRMYLRVRWSGYSTLTYEIPVDGYDNRVRLSSLVRRVARACIHFMQSNGIPITWDRVTLYHLEEVAYGTWQPVLTVR